MKLFSLYILISTILLGAPTSSKSEEVLSMAKQPIIVGDIVLIDINCYMCGVIKDETDSSYSHSGLVIGDNGTEYLIAQSLGKTDVVTTTDFLSNQAKNSSVKILRSKELDYLYRNNPREYNSRIQTLKYMYLHKYQGLKFDREFLWDNVDDNGDELLYCAELIVKVLNEALVAKIKPTPMSFSKNLSYWRKYYGEEPPHGYPGVSPGSLERDRAFKVIMEY
jgi:hypothetical protein